MVIIGVRLNLGFFKTKNYVLYIKEDELIFESGEQGDEEIFKEDIISITLIIKNLDLIEFEINTRYKTYTGIINKGINIEDIILCFKQKFGDKFKVELS